jgi:glycerate-2-kinase
VPSTPSLRQDAIAIYRAGVEAVEPGKALARALAATPPPSDRTWVIALGKAARGMARAAVDHLTLLDVPLAGGLVVSTSAPALAEAGLRAVAGDHPIPGPGSFAAADALGQVAGAVLPHDEVWVLLSGGTSSLIGAPVAEVDPADYAAFQGAVARAGLAIDRLNALRKRFSRWGAGRLLAALRAERVRVFAVSDVPGDRPEDIGSGPCEPDRWRASEVLQLLAATVPRDSLPPTIRSLLDRAARGAVPETPKPGDALFERRLTRIVADNRTAVAAAAARARALGYAVQIADAPLAGEARAAGARLALALRDRARGGHPPAALLAGGETTVALGPTHGTGGRCQELALAAALGLEGAGDGSIALLAAGTDGRDGPTDAAGAVVDPTTTGAIRSRGLDPDAAVARHDAYPVLDAAGALFRPGPTGTNVMDLVIGLVRSAASPGAFGNPAPAPR